LIPALAQILADGRLLVAALGVVVLGVLALGWSVAVWVAEARQARARERRRGLRAALTEIELVCGHEFPQVAATVHYVQGLLDGAPRDVGALRAVLRTANETLRHPGADLVDPPDPASSASARVGPPQEAR
jgi:hypothetical protein